MIDLHIHTNKSDGDFSPTQIVHMAETKNVEIIAITDHDTCEGVEEALKEAKKTFTRVIPGIEVTAFENQEIHILGYNVDYKSELLKEYKKNIAHNLEMEEKMTFDVFKNLGFNIEKRDIIKYTNGGRIFPGHFISWLIENGYEQERRTTYNKYFVEGELRNRKSSRMNVAKAIDFIIALGGTPVFAHPCRTRYSNEQLEEKIKELKGKGLKGIEAIYSKATDIQIDLYIELAQKYDLLITIGSDYHGPGINKLTELGTGRQGNLLKYQEKIEREELVIDLERLQNNTCIVN